MMWNQTLHETVTGPPLTLTADLLIGAGLSSSAALECSVAAAASDLFGLGLLADDAGRVALAVHCQTAENEIAQAPTGGVDQTSALRGVKGHALLIDFLNRTLRPVPYDPASAGVGVLILDTRCRRGTSATATPSATARPCCSASTCCAGWASTSSRPPRRGWTTCSSDGCATSSPRTPAPSAWPTTSRPATGGPWPRA